MGRAIGRVVGNGEGVTRVMELFRRRPLLLVLHRLLRQRKRVSQHSKRSKRMVLNKVHQAHHGRERRDLDRLEVYRMERL